MFKKKHANRQTPTCTCASHARAGAATLGQLSAASVKAISRSSSLHGASVCRQRSSKRHTPARHDLALMPAVQADKPFAQSTRQNAGRKAI